MGDEDKSSKTEEPTAKRLDDARQKGQVAKSKEISFVAVIFAGLICLYFSGGYLYENITNVMYYFFWDAPHLELDEGTAVQFFTDAITQIFFAIIPFLLVIFLVAFIANVAQIGGFLFTLEPLQPKFSKISPAKGIKRVFSMQSVVELIKSLFKIFVTGTVAFLEIMNEWDMIPYTAYMSAWDLLGFISYISLKIIFYVLLVMLIMATADFSFQKFDFNNNMKMTKQEVKDEMKQTDGNPETKRRIKQVQHDLSQKRMMQEVPSADVIITNPTHFACALKYEEGMIAPTLLAKGKDLVAHKIKDIAKEHDIPVVEDKTLARAIYKTTEIGDIIPPDLYQAVAEILAYVYRLKTA